MTKPIDKSPPPETAETLNNELKSYWGELLSLLTYKLRDIDLAEDALQDAILLALTQWPDRGEPEKPKSWLYKVAMNKAIDTLRHRKTVSNHGAELFDNTHEINQLVEINTDHIPDERLRMIFTCCHPAINQPSQIALALRTLCGLKTIDIARSFLVSETTMAQRIVRTKRKIRDAGIPYEIPESSQLKQRLQSVLGVVYLIYNEGYKIDSSEISARRSLCSEAHYLSLCLVELMPKHAEVHGLHALLLLHESRRSARLDNDGKLLMLEDQDRSKWSSKMIRAGFNSLRCASNLHDTGPYQLQAAISAVHAQSASFKTTNWQAIVKLYTLLLEHTSSQVVALNRCVAISYAANSQAGLTEVQKVSDSGELDLYQPYYAAIADMYRRAGNFNQASAAYQRAIELSNSTLERQYLTSRLSSLASPLNTDKRTRQSKLT